MNFIILGAPGSGKGTQAARFAEMWNLNHISTGDLLRDAVARRTVLGKQVAKTLAAGQLVADDIVLELIKQVTAGNGSKAGCEGWILDGYPRTIAQAEALDDLLRDIGEEIEGVILLEIATEIIVERLSNRRTCKGCKAVYNLLNKPPTSNGWCDDCGGELELREDDEPETIRRRLDVYNEETLPVVEFYESRGRLEKVDGSKSIDEVADAISRLVKDDNP